MSHGVDHSPAGNSAFERSDVDRFRGNFPTLRDKVYLISNSMGAVSESLLAARKRYLDERLEMGATWGQGVVAHEELRQSFAELIGARTSEIAICYSASQAVGSIASCFRFDDRPVIVYDDYSFPSIAQLWQAQRRRGAAVRRVAPDARGLIEAEYFDTVLDHQVQAVSVSHACYKNGHRLDLEAIAEKAHNVGALVIVDDYQCCGARRLDVGASGIDILTTGTVKFLLGGPGIALMYVRQDVLKDLHPTATGWFGQSDPDNFQVEAHFEAADASRFQSGTPAFPAVYESLAGIELIRSVGLGRIESWIDRLTAMLMGGLRELGFASATPEDPRKRAAQVAIRSLDGERAVAELARRNILCSTRDNNIRVALHYYNTEDDVSELLAALRQIAYLMVQSGE